MKTIIFLLKFPYGKIKVFSHTLLIYNYIGFRVQKQLAQHLCTADPTKGFVALQARPTVNIHPRRRLCLSLSVSLLLPLSSRGIHDSLLGFTCFLGFFCPLCLYSDLSFYFLCCSCEYAVITPSESASVGTGTLIQAPHPPATVTLLLWSLAFRCWNCLILPFAFFLLIWTYDLLL